ncbi:MAG: recombinase family protein, partial [Bacteroidota bacterium]
MRAALYARISTYDQQTLSMQMKVMREFVANRGWSIAVEMEETSSGVKKREKKQTILQAAKRREVDVIVVWKMERWGRSLVSLIKELQEL